VDHRTREFRPSWICRDPLERARFVDLHRKLLPANARTLALLVAVILAGIWWVPHPAAFLPALAGVAGFGGLQRLAERFQRPELWVYTGLLGAEAAIAAAIFLAGGAATPAMALLVWPAVGVAGRFPNRALILATGYAMLLAAAAIIAADPAQAREIPLSVGLAVTAIVAAGASAAVLRDSDVESRGAAILDPLTGMLNRAALVRRTEELELQSRLTGEPVGVILADLDHFKAVNDTHGHSAGDAVLKDAAYVIRRELRAYDLAYRLGGEEFAILLAGSDAATTAALAERIRAAVAEAPVAGLPLTVSIGVAASERGAEFRWASVYERADGALYRAKAAGRDRVAVDEVRVLA